jgi:hypothetical protein
LSDILIRPYRDYRDHGHRYQLRKAKRIAFKER